MKVGLRLTWKLVSPVWQSPGAVSVGEKGQSSLEHRAWAPGPHGKAPRRTTTLLTCLSTMTSPFERASISKTAFCIPNSSCKHLAIEWLQLLLALQAYRGRRGMKRQPPITATSARGVPPSLGEKIPATERATA